MKWSLVCQNWISSVTVRRSAPPIVFNTRSCRSWRVILVTLLNKMVFTSCTNQCHIYTRLGFYSLDPPQPATPHHCMSPSIVQRYDLKWHNDPGQPVRSSRARRVATLSSGSEHPAKQLKSQNMRGGVWRTHFTVCVLNHMWLVGSIQRE